MARNWWEDEGFSDNMLALGMGLLQGSGPSTDPANRSFGAAFGKGGMAMLAQMQQQKQNKMNERRIGVEEGNLAIKRQELEASLAEMQRKAAVERAWKDQFGVNEVVEGPPIAGEMPRRQLPMSPALSNLPPAFVARLQSMPAKEGTEELGKQTTFGELSPYFVPKEQGGGIAQLKRNPLGQYADEQGNLVSPQGFVKYNPTDWIESEEGVPGKPGYKQNLLVSKLTGEKRKVGDPILPAPQTQVSMSTQPGIDKFEYETSRQEAAKLAEKAEAAIPMITNLEKLRSLNYSTPEGILVPVEKFGADLGAALGIKFNTKGVTNLADFMNINSKILSDYLTGATGRGLTDRDLDVIKDSLASAKTPQEARQVVLDRVIGSFEQSVFVPYEQKITTLRKNFPTALTTLPDADFYRKRVREMQNSMYKGQIPRVVR